MSGLANLVNRKAPQKEKKRAGLPALPSYKPARLTVSQWLSPTLQRMYLPLSIWTTCKPLWPATMSWRLIDWSRLLPKPTKVLSPSLVKVQAWKVSPVSWFTHSPLAKSIPNCLANARKLQ